MEHLVAVRGHLPRQHHSLTLEPSRAVIRPSRPAAGTTRPRAYSVDRAARVVPVSHSVRPAPRIRLALRGTCLSSPDTASGGCRTSVQMSRYNTSAASRSTTTPDVLPVLHAEKFTVSCQAGSNLANRSAAAASVRAGVDRCAVLADLPSISAWVRPVRRITSRGPSWPRDAASGFRYLPA